MNLSGILTSALVLASFAALLTMSCYWNPQGGAGKITRATVTRLCTFSAIAIGVLLERDCPGIPVHEQHEYRVDVSIGPDAYAETSVGLSGGSITMDEVPAGSDYSLVVVFGSYTGTTLVPDQYGQSAPFAVVAGKSTSVKLTAQPVPFSSTALIGKDLKSVVFNSSVFAIYGVDGGNLYSMTGNVFFNPPGSFTQAPAPAGTTINSLTNLSNSVWVNTSTGILQAGSWPTSVYGNWSERKYYPIWHD